MNHNTNSLLGQTISAVAVGCMAHIIAGRVVKELLRSTPEGNELGLSERVCSNEVPQLLEAGHSHRLLS